MMCHTSCFQPKDKLVSQKVNEFLNSTASFKKKNRKTFDGRFRSSVIASKSENLFRTDARLKSMKLPSLNMILDSDLRE